MAGNFLPWVLLILLYYAEQQNAEEECVNCNHVFFLSKLIKRLGMQWRVILPIVFYVSCYTVVSLLFLSKSLLFRLFSLMTGKAISLPDICCLS